MGKKLGIALLISSLFAGSFFLGKYLTEKHYRANLQQTQTAQTMRNMYIANADKVNIRSGAGTNYSILDTGNMGESVTVLGETKTNIGKWYKVNYKGKDGWIYEKYLSINNYPDYRIPTQRTSTPARGQASQSQKQIQKPLIQQTQTTQENKNYIDIINTLVMCKNHELHNNGLKTYEYPSLGWADINSGIFNYNEATKKIKFFYKSDKNLGNITPEKLRDYDIVMIGTSFYGNGFDEPYNDKEIEAVKNYVYNGGLLYIFTDGGGTFYGRRRGQFMHQFGFTPVIYPEEYVGDPTAHGYYDIWFARPDYDDEGQYGTMTYLKIKVKENATRFSKDVDEIRIYNMRPMIIENSMIAEPMLIPDEHIPVRKKWHYSPYESFVDFEYTLSLKPNLAFVHFKYGKGEGIYIGDGLYWFDTTYDNNKFRDNILSWINEKVKGRRRLN